MNKICPLWNGEKGLQLCHGSILNHSVQYSRKHNIFTKPDFLLLAWASYISFFTYDHFLYKALNVRCITKQNIKRFWKNWLGSILFSAHFDMWLVSFMISTYITLTNLSTCWLKKLRNRTYAVKHESSPVTTDSVGFWTGVIILINCGWTGVDSTTFGLTVCGCNGVDVNDPVLTWELRLIF